MTVIIMSILILLLVCSAGWNIAAYWQSLVVGLELDQEYERRPAALNMW